MAQPCSNLRLWLSDLLISWIRSRASFIHLVNRVLQLLQVGLKSYNQSVCNIWKNFSCFVCHHAYLSGPLRSSRSGTWLVHGWPLRTLRVMWHALSVVRPEGLDVWGLIWEVMHACIRMLLMIDNGLSRVLALCRKPLTVQIMVRIVVLGWIWRIKWRTWRWVSLVLRMARRVVLVLASRLTRIRSHVRRRTSLAGEMHHGRGTDRRSHIRGPVVANRAQLHLRVGHS